MSRFLPASLTGLAPYTPGEQPKTLSRLIKLNTNESPFPPAPAVRAVLTEEAACDLRLYPDPQGMGLKAALADVFRVKPSEIHLANGSDDALYFAFLAYCKESPAVFCDLTYGFYEVFADLVGAEKIIVPLKEDFSVDVEALCAVKGTVFLANPNAPTGLCLPLFEIGKLLESDPDRIVVVDEAYVDFGGESALKLLGDHDNLIVVRTFSKSASMAGARLGFAVANEEVIADLERIRYSTNPYNLNRLTLLLGEATVKEKDYAVRCIADVVKAREWTRENLEKLGFFVTDSRANFLFARPAPTSPTAEKLYEALKARGILVRYFSTPRAKDFLRISIGSMEEMQTLILELSNLLEETL